MPGDIPDYVAGHLVYYDAADGCHWVVYDGETWHKFPSRGAAMRFAVARAAGCSDEQLNTIMIAQYRSRQISEALGKLFVAIDEQRTRQLHAIAARLRAISDELDTIAAHFIATRAASGQSNEELKT